MVQKLWNRSVVRIHFESVIFSELVRGVEKKFETFCCLCETLTSDLDGVWVSKRQEGDHPPHQTLQIKGLWS